LIIPVFGLNSIEEYLQHSEEVDKKVRPHFCPRCKRKSSFWRHGKYSRKVQTERASFEIRINRFKCRDCGLVVSCVYSFLIPYAHYSLKTVATAVENFLEFGGTYSQQAAELSDLAADKQFKPSATQIFKWVALLVSRSEQLHFQLQKEQLMRNANANFDSLPALTQPTKVSTRSAAKGARLKWLKSFSQNLSLFFGGCQLVFEVAHAFFFCKVESLQAFFCARALRLPTPQSSISLQF
jgi:hypothetical protein